MKEYLNLEGEVELEISDELKNYSATYMDYTRKK
jgi:hypothetical protein